MSIEITLNADVAVNGVRGRVRLVLWGDPVCYYRRDTILGVILFRNAGGEREALTAEFRKVLKFKGDLKYYGRRSKPRDA